jgi:hypothetical protein
LKPAKFLRKGENSEGVPGFPIIPLVPSLCEPIEIGSQDLPCPYEISLDEIKGRIRSRASTVVQTVVNLNRNLQAGQLLRQMGTLIKQKRGLISLINLIREKGEEWSWTILRAPAHYYGTRLVTKKAVESIGRARDEVEGAFRS